MKNATFGLIALVPALALTFACDDPSKRVGDTDANHDADVHAAQATKMNNEVDFQRDRAAAVSNLAEARATFRTASNVRLEKVNITANALDAKRANGGLPAETSPTLRSKYSSVKASLASLDDVQDVNWNITQKSVDASLVSLEKDAHDAGIAL